MSLISAGSISLDSTFKYLRKKCRNMCRNEERKEVVVRGEGNGRAIGCGDLKGLGHEIYWNFVDIHGWIKA
jgi:hypothetical protein